MCVISRKGKSVGRENQSVFAWGQLWDQRLIANGAQEPQAGGEVLALVCGTGSSLGRVSKIHQTLRIKMVKFYSVCISPQKGPGAISRLRGVLAIPLGARSACWGL